MTPYYSDDAVTLYAGDCLDVLRGLPDASVDAVVTDPPYGLEFMGREWDKFGKDTGNHAHREKPRFTSDHMGKGFDKIPNTYEAGAPFQRWCYEWAVECLRVLKPGGMMLAFGGTRTWHRLACAIEDAGFEVRDSIAWLYGSGFPKSLDVSKAIDATQLHGKSNSRGIKAATGSRDVVGPSPYAARRVNPVEGDWAANHGTYGAPGANITAPATDDARTWQGWGTALKPAHEPIVVARRPLNGTVAANVLAHGTGAINVDACRVAHTTVNSGNLAENPHLRAGWERSASSGGVGDGFGFESAEVQIPAGRWPPNVLLDDHAAAELDRQSGTLTSGAMRALTRSPDSDPMFRVGEALTYETYGDTGGASRFFPTFRYEAKAPTSERPRVAGEGNGTQNYGGYKVRCCDTCAKRSPATGPLICGHDAFTWTEPLDRQPGNVSHPTVKPLALMRWLVRLVTPPGGIVLDPFAGSGTTGEAAILEHKRAILIEREADYLPLIVARLSKPLELGFDFGDGAA